MNLENGFYSNGNSNVQAINSLRKIVGSKEITKMGNQNCNFLLKKMMALCMSKDNITPKITCNCDFRTRP
jgi:hypothetical protein